MALVLAEPTENPDGDFEPDENTDPSTWGTNYQRMPKRFSKALLDLAKGYREARAFSRRYQVKQSCEARYYWRGLNYVWWDTDARQFRIVGVDELPEDIEPPRYDFATNLFRSYGLAFIAVVSEGKINIRFWPQNGNQQEDLDTAKVASSLVDLIERDNDVDTMNIEECYLAFVDPVYAYRIHYELDGEEYGYDQVDELGEEQGPLGAGVAKCPTCGMESPAAGAPDEAAGAMPCPTCGTPMGYAPPIEAAIPTKIGTKEYERGKVRLEFVSLLELDIPMRARKQKQVSDLTWKREIHYAKLMETYPHAAERIRKAAQTSSSSASSSGDSAHSGLSADEDTERRLRLRALSMDDAESQEEGLVTFCETWLRRWTLNSLPADTDEQKVTRDTLKKAFPTGARLCGFGDTYIEATDESMDEGWELVALMPGESLDAGSVGADEVSVQRRHTTLDNIEMETHERGIPPTFSDPNVVDPVLYAQSTAMPGNVYDAKMPVGGKVSDGMYTPPPLAVSSQATVLRNDLFGPISQHILGTYPAAYGGDLGSNDTAAGIAIQRNQAKGRLGIFYRNMKKHRSHALAKGVECLRRHATSDLTITLLDPGSKDFLAKTVRLDQLTGSIYAHPESDEGFPASWAEKQGQILKLLTNQITAPAFTGSVKNMEAVQRYTGLGDLDVPGAASRQKQLREIRTMLEHGAMGIGPIQTEQGPDPLSGMPLPPLMESSVPVDDVMDNHAVEFATCMEWAASDEGQEARTENPPGYLNVRLHAQAHQTAMAPPPMLGPPGPPGARPPATMPPGGPP